MVSKPVPFRAFTTRYNGLSHVLANKVGVTAAFDLKTSSPPDSVKEFIAVWDTGATNSVITQRVIDDCQLKPTGIAEVHTAQGSHRTETFLVGILLPNRVGFPQVRVSKGILAGTGDVDVLIGMDIIATGDFAVTNVGGKTSFSFRIPLMESIDYVKMAREQLVQPKVGRNAQCPCGSGKKYKRCHGFAT